MMQFEFHYGGSKEEWHFATEPVNENRKSPFALSLSITASKVSTSAMTITS